MLHLLEVSLILCMISISGKGWEKNWHQECGMSPSSPVFDRQSRLLCHVRFIKKREAGVWNQGTLMILFCVLSASYVEIILEAKIHRVFSYPDIGDIKKINILSISHKLADTDPSGTLESCFGTKMIRKIHIIIWFREKI